MMIRIIYVLLLSCVFSSAYMTEVRAGTPDAALLIKEIKAKGAKTVIAELAIDDEMTQFEKVCDKIETGNKEWLEVAKLLLPGSDAATTEGLVYSVARALPKAPRQVLDLIAETEHDRVWAFTVNNICISTFIEPEPGVAEKYLTESEKALKSMDTGSNQKLNNLRLKCLKSIQKDISYLKKHGIWKPK
jgi:hypothetical protein